MSVYVAGIDIVSATSKATILSDDGMVAEHLIPTGPASRESADAAMAGALESAGLSADEVSFIVATGYGRINVPSADKVITEIACHARGVHHIFPEARTVLDMGGQDCKAIRVGSDGRHTAFAMNDKCAAGTGRFFDVMSSVLKVPLTELGSLSLQAETEPAISSVCTVFARTEVTRLQRKGIPKADILGGLYEATSSRVVSLLKRVGIEAEFVISGGVAKNVGMVRKIEAKVGLPARIADEPQTIGSLGAALFAMELATKE
jgi:predicted CoA-substrate-specific enzyme activase